MGRTWGGWGVMICTKIASLLITPIHLLPPPPPLLPHTIMSDLTIPRVWNSQAVATNHCVVPSAADFREMYLQYKTPTSEVAAERVPAYPEGKWTPGMWDPTIGSVVFSVVNDDGNMLSDRDTTGYDPAIACVNMLDHNQRIYLQGIATGQLESHPENTAARTIAVQVDGGVDTLNTGPHTFVRGDIVVAMFPTLDESRTVMAYGRRYDSGASGRLELELWPLRQLVQELTRPEGADGRGLRTIRASPDTDIYIAANAIREVWKEGPTALVRADPRDAKGRFVAAALRVCQAIKASVAKQQYLFVEMGIRDKYTEFVARIGGSSEANQENFDAYAEFIRGVTHATYTCLERRIGGRVLGTAAIVSGPNDPLYVLLSRRATYPSITTYLQ